MKELFERLIIGVRLFCWIVGALVLLAVLDFILTATANLHDAGQEARATLRESRAVVARANEILSDERVAKWDKYTDSQMASLLYNTNNSRKTFNNINELVKDARPRINRQLDESAELTAEFRWQIKQNGDATRRVLDDFDPLLVDLRDRLKDPELQRLVSNLATAAGQTGETLESLRATNEEIKAELPALLDQLTRMANNSADLTGEAAEFIKTLNRPTTKKQRLWRAIIQAAAIAAPVAIRR